MATLAQLQAEPYWGNETVPATLNDLMARLCTRYGVPRYNAGAKGDENHLYGRHRSIEWSLSSAYCQDRSYGTVDGRDRRGNWRHIRAFDLSLPGAHLYPLCRRLDTAVRAGRLPKVAEWFGTFDGNTVVGWYEGRASTSDDSHLWHLHLGLWTENADDDHTDLYEILTGEDMNEEQARQLYNLDRLNSALLAGAKTVTKVQLQDGTYADYPLWLAKDAETAANRPPIELTDAQLDALADKLAARLGHGNISLTGTLTPPGV